MRSNLILLSSICASTSVHLLHGALILYQPGTCCTHSHSRSPVAWLTIASPPKQFLSDSCVWWCRCLCPRLCHLTRRLRARSQAPGLALCPAVVAVTASAHSASAPRRRPAAGAAAPARRKDAPPRGRQLAMPATRWHPSSWTSASSAAARRERRVPRSRARSSS